MKARISFACVLTLLGSILQTRAAEDVDLLLVNGNVYTANEKQPHAEAIAVKGDRIVFVGVASAHRQAAFQAAEFLMDYLKTRAPFWKREQRGQQETWVEARDEDDESVKRWR